MQDIKQQEEMNKRLRDVKDPNGIYFISYLGQNEIKTLENFIQSEISLAVEQERERAIEAIKKEQEKTRLEQFTVDKIITLINNK